MLLFAAVGLTPPCVSGSSDLSDNTEWETPFVPAGVVESVEVLTADGNSVYIGGSFNSVAGREIDGVARWENGQWMELGDGLDGVVRSIEVNENGLYAGGNFPDWRGTESGHIAHWDGEQWNAVSDGIDGRVHAVETVGEKIYVGGDFHSAGGITVNGIACWNGEAWSALPGPREVGVTGTVYSLAADADGNLYVGGGFTKAGGIQSNGMARWSGRSWAPLGTGLARSDGLVEVRALVTDDGRLVAAGRFDMAGGRVVNHIAQWDGRRWRGFSSGLRGGEPTFARALAVDSEGLYVAGAFEQAGAAAVQGVGHWDGEHWRSVGPDRLDGARHDFQALTVTEDGRLFLGGMFREIGGVAFGSLAQWNGRRWRSLGNSLNGPIQTIARIDGQAYIGGDFSHAGGIVVNHIAQWDGGDWHPLGAGLDGTVHSILEGPDGGVVAGGEFTMADGQKTGGIAVWRDGGWEALGGRLEGAPATVKAMARVGGRIYVGGTFQQAGGTAVGNLAVWDGDRWRSLMGGVDGPVFTLTASKNRLFVGGAFRRAGELEANSLAVWDVQQENWSSVGGGLFDSMNSPATVRAIAIQDDAIYIGGRFDQAGSVDAVNVARFKGGEWSALRSGSREEAIGEVRVLRSMGERMLAGGAFGRIGGVGASGLAVWNGTTWTPVGEEVAGPVNDVIFARGRAWVGGDFNQVQGMPATHLAHLTGALPMGLQILSPVNGARYALGETIDLEVEWTGKEPGGDAEVVFFRDGYRIGATGAPWKLEWTDAVSGKHFLRARATFGDGKTIRSGPVWARIAQPPGTKVPEVEILEPTTGSELTVGQSPLIKAEARDPDGAIRQVELFVNGRIQEVVQEPPFQYRWELPMAGKYRLKARAVDNQGASSMSDGVNVEAIAENRAPSVRFVQPRAGKVFSASETIELHAAVDDEDGNLDALELLANGELLKRMEPSDDFAFSWEGMEPGKYRVTARVSDAAGATDSASVSIRIYDPASPPPEPFQADERQLPTYLTTDGRVNTILRTNETIYLGGKFCHIGRQIPGSVVAEVSADGLSFPYPGIGGRVNVVVPDGSRGFYIGGLFDRIGGETCSNLAHVSAYGRVNPVWDPETSGHVTAILPLEKQVLIGGEFREANGRQSRYFVSVSRTFGNTTDWAPQVDGPVYSILRHGDRVYVGGGFETIGGQPRAGLAALDRKSGEVIGSWDPGGDDGTISAMAARDGTLYVAGRYLTFGGAFRRGLMALDIVDASVEPFDAHAGDANIEDLIATPDRLYVAGDFREMGGRWQNNLAAVDLERGTRLGWSQWVGTDGSIRAMALSGRTLYVSGNFTKVGEEARHHFAAIDATTGESSTLGVSPSGYFDDFVTAPDGRVLGAGSLEMLNREQRIGIAAIDSHTGNLRPFTSGIHPEGEVHDFAATDGALYVAGSFGQLGGRDRNYLGAIDLTSGKVRDVSFGPSTAVYAIAIQGETLYAGGAFVSIGGHDRRHIASLDLRTGNATSWNPVANDQVRALAIRGDRVYAGGPFTRMAGRQRSHLAALDIEGAELTDWDPSPSHTVNDLAFGDEILYVGGGFDTIGGRAREGIAAIDLDTGRATPWSADAHGTVMSLSYAGEVIFFGGQFDGVRGESRRNLAAAATRRNTHNILSWSPRTDGTVHAVSARGDSVIAGGRFDMVNERERLHVAAFSVRPRLRLAGESSDRADGLEVVGLPFGTWALQVSTDLVHWQSSRSVKLGAEGRIHIDDLTPEGRGRLFYRSVEGDPME